MHVAGVYSLSLPKLQPAFFLCWTMSLLLQRQTHELVIKKITKLVEQHLMRFVKRAPRSEQDVYPSCLQNLCGPLNRIVGWPTRRTGDAGRITRIPLRFLLKPSSHTALSPPCRLPGPTAVCAVLRVVDLLHGGVCLLVPQAQERPRTRRRAGGGEHQ